jgi:polyisoprenoid-binding protein YceI
MVTDAAVTARAQYAIDPKLTRFVVHAFATGFLSMFAHSPKIAIRGLLGDITFDPDAPDTASVKVVVDPMTLAVLDDTRDKAEIERVMREEVLEVSRFREVVFESTRVAATKLADTRYRADATGRLSLHGVTRAHTVTADVVLMGDLLRSNGAFTVLQSDYDITPVSIGGSAIKVKDELKFTFDLVARRRT